MVHDQHAHESAKKPTPAAQTAKPAKPAGPVTHATGTAAAHGYLAQRAAVKPANAPSLLAQRDALKPPHATTAANPAAASVPDAGEDLHDGLKPAIADAGGIVPFMKAMAAGQTVDGIGPEKFHELWNVQENEDWLKDRFRAVSPNMHEWIPSNEIDEVVEKARKTADGAAWIDVHNELRSPTPDLVFCPTKYSHEQADGKLVPHGHVGAIYLNGAPQTKHQATFHDELRAAFLAAPDLMAALDGSQAVAEKWIWDGTPPPKPLSDDLKDSMGRPLDPVELVTEQAAQHDTMVRHFQDLKGKHGGKHAEPKSSQPKP